VNLAPYQRGVELAPLVARLHAFPRPATWTAHMRRALLPLDAHDAELLTRLLDRVAGPPSAAVDGYIAAVRAMGRHSGVDRPRTSALRA
jgi:hypothetical protein